MNSVIQILLLNVVLLTITIAVTQATPNIPSFRDELKRAAEQEDTPALRASFKLFRLMSALDTIKSIIQPDHEDRFVDDIDKLRDNTVVWGNRPALESEIGHGSLNEPLHRDVIVSEPDPNENDNSDNSDSSSPQVRSLIKKLQQLTRRRNSDMKLNL